MTFLKIKGFFLLVIVRKNKESTSADEEMKRKKKWVILKIFNQSYALTLKII